MKWIPHFLVLMGLLLGLACSGGADSTDSVVESELLRTFKAEVATLADNHIPETSKLVRGRDEWLLMTSELRYAASGPFWGEAAARVNPKAPPEKADPVPAIVHFNAELATRGIELLFMPVPVRPIVYPESVLPDHHLLPSDGAIPHLFAPEVEFLNVLRSNGVKVVELTPLFLEHRDSQPGPLFTSSDPHWTPSGVALTARTIAGVLADREWLSTVPKLDFTERWTIDKHFGSTFRLLEEKAGETREADLVPARRIKLKTAKGLQRFEQRMPSSPVVLIGDSNTIWWNKWSTSLPHQLAFELGFQVDVLSTPGGGANETRLNLSRLVQSDPSYLEGKKVVIWCFSARALTNTKEGWINIPLQ